MLACVGSNALKGCSVNVLKALGGDACPRGLHEQPLRRHPRYLATRRSPRHVPRQPARDTRHANPKLTPRVLEAERGADGFAHGAEEPPEEALAEHRPTDGTAEAANGLARGSSRAENLHLAVWGAMCGERSEVCKACGANAGGV